MTICSYVDPHYSPPTLLLIPFSCNKLSQIISNPQSLFERIGPVLKLELKYDRAGRSEGVAFVTYEKEAMAHSAIEQFDSANAHGVSRPLVYHKTPSF